MFNIRGLKLTVLAFGPLIRATDCVKEMLGSGLKLTVLAFGPLIRATDYVKADKKTAKSRPDPRVVACGGSGGAAFDAEQYQQATDQQAGRQQVHAGRGAVGGVFDRADQVGAGEAGQVAD